MDLLVVNANPAIGLWTHFLLNQWEIGIEERAAGTGAVSRKTLTKVGDGYRAALNPTTGWVRLTVTVSCVIGTRTFLLISIRQDFDVDQARGDVREVGWKKGAPSDPIGRQKGIPPRHPLLTLVGATVGLNIRFVDVTELFLQLHGGSPWLKAYFALRRRDQTWRVVASLGGHPLVWHVFVPAACRPLHEVRPAVMVMPADYGAIWYPNSLAGLSDRAHGISVGDVQSGLEIVARMMLEPLTDDRYRRDLAAYVSLRKGFTGPVGNNPAALHHFRPVVTYTPDAGGIDPEYWDPPVGLERAIEETKSVLFLPIMNGGEGGVLIKPGVQALLANAVLGLYSQSDVFTDETDQKVSVSKPVLMAYSQSGGNVFTSADRNVNEVRGLVLLEPQYVNGYLLGEDHKLTLGKNVIQRLLDNEVKVVVAGRHRELPGKYLPNGRSAGITLLPDAANYSVLAYPLPASGAVHPVVARRYSRLVAGDKDRALTEILGSTQAATYDQSTIDTELAVNAYVDRQRKAGTSDATLIRRVYSPKYELDEKGAFYPHSLILTGGQTLDAGGETYRSFLHEALALIG